MTRTADRPTADSETWRNAVRAVSAAAGRSTPVSSSPGASAFAPSPVTRSATASRRWVPSGRAIAATPSSAAVYEVIGPAGSDRQMLPPTVATFWTLNEPSSASQHCRARCAPGARDGCAGRQRASSASVQVAAMRRPSSVSVSAWPAEGVQVKQAPQPRLGLGEQPGAAAEPRVSVAPTRSGGRRVAADGVQVHARSYLPTASTLLIMP